MEASYETLKGLAKHALTAVMRRLLGLLNAMLRDRLTWDQLAVNNVTTTP